METMDMTHYVIILYCVGRDRTYTEKESAD